mgnify:CR=1 FL=1
MSKGNTFENDLLLLIFNNTDAALIGDATGLRGSSTAGSLYVSLHTGDPGEAGNQTTNECAYGSYARVAVARSGAGWTVSGTAPTQVVNAAGRPPQRSPNPRPCRPAWTARSSRPGATTRCSTSSSSPTC